MVFAHVFDGAIWVMVASQKNKYDFDFIFFSFYDVCKDVVHKIQILKPELRHK